MKNWKSLNSILNSFLKTWSLEFLTTHLNHWNRKHIHTYSFFGGKTPMLFCLFLKTMVLHVNDSNEYLFTCQKWIPFQNIFNLSLPIVRALFLVIRHRKRYLIAKQHNFRVTSAILQSMLTFLKSSLKGVYAWLSKPKILVQLMWNIVQRQFESYLPISES